MPIEFEYYYKRIRNGKKMSWVPPRIYADRFYEFMKDVIFPKEGRQVEDEEDD